MPLCTDSMPELYRLDFASGRAYIGVTRHTAAARFSDHRRAARSSAKGVLYGAWRKHGEPRLTVLAILALGDMYDAERRAVAVYGTRFPQGYNLTDGGDVPPSLSPEVARKISQALRGRTLSTERRLHIASVLAGRRHTPEARARMSKAQTGRKFSVAHIEKLAAAKRGRPLPARTRANMSAAQRARRRAELMYAAMKGRP